MSGAWLTHEELVAEHRQLKTEVERLKGLIEGLQVNYADHIHGTGALYAFTELPIRKHPPSPKFGVNDAGTEVRENPVPAE